MKILRRCGHWEEGEPIRWSTPDGERDETSRFTVGYFVGMGLFAAGYMLGEMRRR